MKVAVQLNDTHPSLAIVEMMRLLVDVEHLSVRSLRSLLHMCHIVVTSWDVLMSYAVGRRVGDHHEDVRVHQPHGVAYVSVSAAFKFSLIDADEHFVALLL